MKFNAIIGNRRMHLIYLLLLICLPSCEKDEVLVTTDQIIRLQIYKSQRFANGLDTVEIDAFIPKKAEEDKRDITFQTNLGHFVKNQNQSITIKAEADSTNSDLVASVVLRAPVTSDTAVITAQILRVAVTESIPFDPSEAESLKLSASKFGIANNFQDEILLKGQLSAKKGLPSTGTTVKIEVKNDSTNTNVNGLRFRADALKSDENGQVSIIFNAGDLEFIGTLRIIGLVDGTEIKDSVLIEVF